MPSLKELQDSPITAADAAIVHAKASVLSGMVQGAGQSIGLLGNLAFTTETVPGAPTIGSVSAGGAVDDGTHYYKVTFVTAEGETEASIYSEDATTAGGNNTVNLTAIPVGSAKVTSRKIYRALKNTTHNATNNAYAPCYLVGTIPNNTATTFVDAIADSALTTIAPRDNTTGGVLYLDGVCYGYSGAYNTFFGLNSGNLSGGGIGNTGLGANVLKENTTGYNNQALGNGCLYHNTTGYFNSAFGSDALFTNADGYNNTGLGVDALHFNVSGINCTAVGVRALNKCLANSNTAIGYEALFNVTSGTDNFGGGDQAMHALTTGHWNVGVGTGSLAANSTGWMNVGVGLYAGAAALGNNNVFLGGYAGAEMAGANNLALGAHAGRHETGSNSFYVNNVDETTVAQDKAFSLLYGTFSGTAATLAGQQLRVNANLGLGVLSADATASLTLVLSNSAVAPTASVDLAYLYCADNGAGHATLAIYAEEVVAAIGIKVANEVFPILINGVVKNVMLAA